MSRQQLSLLGKDLSRAWSESDWKWLTSTRIRPAFVIRAVVKWSLILSLSTVVLAIVYQRDPLSASLVLGATVAGALLYMIVDEITGAVFEDDPVLLREHKTP